MWNFICYYFSLTQLCLILWTCCSGLQPARPSCPSSSPRVFPSSSSCPLHQRCHQAILSSVTLFSFCPQSFIESGAFPMSVQGEFPLRLTGLISLLARGSQESSPAPEFKGTEFLVLCLLSVLISQPNMPTGKTIALTIWIFQSPSAVILEPKKRKSVTTSTFPPLICREVMGPECHELNFF